MNPIILYDQGRPSALVTLEGASRLGSFSIAGGHDETLYFSPRTDCYLIVCSEMVREWGSDYFCKQQAHRLTPIEAAAWLREHGLPLPLLLKACLWLQQQTSCAPFEANGDSTPLSPTVSEALPPGRRSVHEIDCLAVQYLVAHQDADLTEISRALRCSWNTLKHKCPNLKVAMQARDARCREPRRGWKTADGNIEAVE